MKYFWVMIIIDRFNEIKESIANTMDLPRDVVLNLPKITITGDDEIIIENHKGISLFNENKIEIKSNIGPIIINGKKLEILYIGGSTITVGGKFQSILYEGLKQDES